MQDQPGLPYVTGEVEKAIEQYVGRNRFRWILSPYLGRDDWNPSSASPRGRLLCTNNALVRTAYWCIVGHVSATIDGSTEPPDGDEKAISLGCGIRHRVRYPVGYAAIAQ